MGRLPAVAVALVLPLFALGCGAGQETTPTPEVVEGTVPQETVAEGDPEAGKAVFDAASPSCGSCHTFEPAGATGTSGPNLDESLQGKDAEYIHESIVNPSAEITEGFSDIMPKTYGQDLSDEQIADLVAFLQKS